MDRAKVLKDTVAITGKKQTEILTSSYYDYNDEKKIENLISLLIYCLKYINKVMFNVMIYHFLVNQSKIDNP